MFKQAGSALLAAVASAQAGSSFHGVATYSSKAFTATLFPGDGAS